MLKELDKIYRNISDITNESIASNVLLVFCILKYFHTLSQSSTSNKYKHDVNFYLEKLAQTEEFKEIVISTLEQLSDSLLKQFPNALADTLSWLNSPKTNHDNVFQVIDYFKKIELFKQNGALTLKASEIFLRLKKIIGYKNNIKKLSIENVVARLALLLNTKENVALSDPMCGNGDLLVLTGNTFKENSRVVHQIQCHVKNNNQAEHVYFILFINGFMNINMIEQSIEMRNMPELFLGTESDIVISILDDDSFTHASTDLYFETYMENICNKIGCGMAILGFYARISNKILSKKICKTY